MPYIVTTKRPTGDCAWAKVLPASRRAVATLEDRRGPDGIEDGARTIAYAQVIDAYGGPDRDDASPAETEHLWQAANVPEQGGTVGPLPDGSLIEVARATNAELMPYAGFDVFNDTPAEAEIIDAFNAGQS
jgi:hypothetical protein